VVAVGNNAFGQCNVDSWKDITQVAGGECHTVGLKTDGTVVAAGPEIELAKWNLGVIEQHALTISSTPNGSVTTPGEGTFTYNAGRIVRLVAKPKAGYRFVRWTGDVDTIFNVKAATTVVRIYGDYEITANFARNWPLIGGIIGGVVAAGLATFFIRTKLVSRPKKLGKKKARKKRR